MTTPTSPGWYDDPEAPEQLRYFDGIVWSRHTTPRAGLAATPAVAAPAQPATGTPTPAAIPPHSGPPQPGPPMPPGPGQWPGQGGHGQQWPGQVGQWPAGQHPVVPTTRDGIPLASYRQRVGAFLVDGVIKVVLNLVLAGYPFYLAFRSYIDDAMDAARAGKSTPMTLDMSQVHLGWLTVYVLITGVVGLIYSVAFNVRRGATPGKSAVGISVRKADQPGPLDVTTAVRRAAIPFLVAITSFLPVVSTLALLLWVADDALPLTQQRRQALHDLLAGTQVVRGPQPPRR
ncbi:MAG: RDD family protein [Nostocoides sp.]